METMPIGATIARAYGFLIIRFFSILGLIWLPVAIAAVGAVIFAPDFFARAARIAEAGPSLALWRDEAELLAMLVAALMIFSVQVISLSRVALDIENDRFVAHFAFGAREGQFFFASLRLSLGLAAIIAVLCAIAYLIGGQLGRWGLASIPFDENGLPVLAEFWSSSALTGTVWVVVFGACAVALYAALRFGFFLAPIAAAEAHTSLRRAGELGMGQCWRMFAIMLGLTVPVGAMILVGSYFALGADFGRFYGFAVEPGQYAQHLADMGTIITAHAVPLMALKAAGLFAISALFAGAAANAYRSIEPKGKMIQWVEKKPRTATAIAAPVPVDPVAAAAASRIIAATPAPAAAPVAARPAPAKTSIESSLLEQFGARFQDPAPPEDRIPPREKPVAAMHEAAPGKTPEPIAKTTAPQENIFALNAFDEIHDAAKNGIPPMPEKFKPPLTNPQGKVAAPAPAFGPRMSDSGRDWRK